MNLKNIVKQIAALIPLDFYQKLSAYSIIRDKFPEISKIQTLETRECLWDFCIKVLNSSDLPTTYIEFGVHQGYSIKYFSSKLTQTECKFFGLDSFEGLPEAWAGLARGAFNTNGDLPTVSDRRIFLLRASSIKHGAS